MTVKDSADQTSDVGRDDAAAAIVRARRAALAGRYAAGSFTVEWRGLARLDPFADAWRALAARALEPNVFYEPSFALAAATVFGRDAGAVLVWSGASPRELVGFFPARIEMRRYGFKVPVLVGWTHAYGPLGTPLVAREAAEAVVAAFLHYLATEPAMPGLLLLPWLRSDGAFAAVLDTILRRAQMPAADFNRRERAMLAPGEERGQYVEEALGSRRRKELRRLWRRLGDTGAVLLTSTANPAALVAGIEDFLTLEAGGWKGRAGTAAAVHDSLRHFVRAAVAGLGAEGKVSLHRLLVDGRAIAVGLVLRSGASAWFWKIAYDETFARFSPGVMVTVALTEELAEDTTIVSTDSCAVAGHPMIDHIWRERATLCDRLIAVRPQAQFARARRLEKWRGLAIAGAKTVRSWLRRG